MKIYFLLLYYSIYWLNSLSVYAQQVPHAIHPPNPVKLSNADFNTAKEITDSIVGPINVSLGYGLQREFEKGIYENNSAWFKFFVDHDTILSFDIVPVDSLDDYDFVIFKCPSANCMDNIKNNKVKPSRMCFSYCTSKSGITGLSRYSRDINIGPGPGPAFVAALHVKKGETYYLMVDCNMGYNGAREERFPLGFFIYFYDYWPKRVPIVLNNIFFEINKAVLLPESFPALNKLASQLKQSQMKIEVRGHADGQGEEIKNQILSEERAKAVIDYLISKRISTARLFSKGFGSTKPIADNATEEGRKKNRRVEFVKVIY